MPYDPTIALKVAQPQFDVGTAMQNALALRNTQQAGQLNQLKLQQEQQAMQEAAGLQNYLAQNPDLSSEEAQNRLVSQYGQKGIDILNTRQELANRRRQGQIYQQEYDENHHKEVNRAVSDIAKYENKADALAGIERNYEEGKLDDAAYNSVKSMVQSEPVWARSQSKILQSLLSEKERLEVSKPTTEERTDGQYKWQVYSNPNLPNYGQEVLKSRIKMQLTPAQKEEQRQFNITEARLAKAAEAKADAPTDSDPKVGKAFLSSINWKADEKGGESDDVSALIRKSTSGGLETFGASAMRFFDRTTEGMKALSALKTRAADLTLKLLGGKLGSGVSNADREFMQQKTADIGNSSLTAEERLSAWNDLVNRMKTIAGVASAAPMPGGAGAGAGANVANPYANLSNEQLLQQLSSPQGVR